MDMKLTRNDYGQFGIFGKLESDDGEYSSLTLEHAYDNGQGGWAPKVPVGLYQCQRGTHQLAHMTSQFETFEIMNVPGHTNILFHIGNFNEDSEGCVLLGRLLAYSNQVPMLMDSRERFWAFMALQDGIDSFSLIVV